MEPIKLEFIVKGDIDKELAKIKLAIKGVGDESYTSFNRLLGSSNESFNGLSKSAQLQAVSLQKVIQQLRQNEAAQQALYNKFEEGKLTSDEYAQAQSRLAVQQSELRAQASAMSRDLERQIQINSMVSGSLEEKHTLVSNLKEEYSKLNKEERENEKIGGQLVERINELNGEIDEINGGLKKTTEETNDVVGSLEGIPGPIGNGVSQFRQLLNAAKSFITTPVGIFVAGLAAAFGLLKIAIDASDTETTKYEASLKALGSIVDTCKQAVYEFIASWKDFITLDWNKLKGHQERFDQLDQNLLDYAKSAYKAGINQDALNDSINRNNDLISVNSSRVSALRQELMNINKTDRERKNIANEIISIEKESYTMQIANTVGLYKNFKDANKRVSVEIQEQYKKELSLAENYMSIIEQKGELTYTQQKELINSVNDITGGYDKTDEETKEKLRSFYNGLISYNKEF